MPKGIHHLEAWNEAVCAGVWGRLLARVGEKLRRGVDLEHSSAFHDSFERLCEWLEHPADGAEVTRPPASIVLLGGNVHNAYINKVTLRTRESAPSRVFQVVCSPFRNPLSFAQRIAVRLINSRGAAAALARLAGVAPSRAEWEFVRRPSFHNSIGELDLDRRRARVTLYRSAGEFEDRERLRKLDVTELATEVLAGAETLSRTTR